MKKSVTVILSLLLAVSCGKIGPVEVLQGENEFAVEAEIAGTKAGEDSVLDRPEYIGRYRFIEGDRMVITKMERTGNPISLFTYSGLEYTSNDSQAWSRDLKDGKSEKIYWSDNVSPHTIIGYSTPMAWTLADKADKWSVNDAGLYSGYFTASEGVVDMTGQTEIQDEDLLLTYSDAMQAETGGSVAILHYKHALSSVRIVVNITGFAHSDGSSDVHTVVSNLEILNQPWKYSWNQSSAAVTDATLPGDGTVTINAWNVRPGGYGENKNKNFVFQSLIVPGTQTSFDTQFQVTYPDATNLGNTVTKRYSATLAPDVGVNFLPGHTTTINISLNHENEEIIIGAEYMDWDYVASPDEGELWKSSIYLNSVARSEVTIAGDAGATVDDATWLYVDGDRVLDIYGNEGTLANPYQIKTAAQFLSFMYEVNKGTRLLASDGVNVFTDKYIALESELYLQPHGATKDFVVWPGIGSVTGRAFNGRLMANLRNVRQLNGAPLFNHIGRNGHIDQLMLQDVIEISNGHAAFAELNEGVICASLVGSKMLIDSGFDITAESGYVASFCAENRGGAIIICHSIDNINATGAGVTAVSGLVGLNSGVLVSCYSAGKISRTNESAPVYGICARNVPSLYKDEEDQRSGLLYLCVYDSNLNPLPVTHEGVQSGEYFNLQDGTGAWALPTNHMQSPLIVGNPEPFHGVGRDYYAADSGNHIEMVIDERGNPIKDAEGRVLYRKYANGIPLATQADVDAFIAAGIPEGPENQVGMPMADSGWKKPNQCSSLNEALRHWASVPDFWPKRIHEDYINDSHPNSIVIAHLSSRSYRFVVSDYPWMY